MVFDGLGVSTKRWSVLFVPLTTQVTAPGPPPHGAASGAPEGKIDVAEADGYRLGGRGLAEVDVVVARAGGVGGD